MLTEVKNNYNSILKHFDFDESVSSVNYKKQKLIDMANSGKAKPTTKTKLGKLLSNYTNKASPTYDAKFDKTIRKLAPNWFISTSQIMKDNLIEMAINKKPKPSRKTKMGRALSEYTKKSSRCFDSDFDKTIRKIAPNWFISKSQITKDKLVEMAKNGEPRPSQKTKLGRALSEYTKKSSRCFDANFYKTINKLRPDWFVSQKQIANQKKKQLIEMAKNGDKRPAYEKTKLGKALSNYTRKLSKAYDPIFDKTIRKLRPDWFDLALLRNNNAH
jgi:molybdenum-dependent DNA-binding transcriptional regulator ModE